jgi:hypothetical protein
VFTAPAIRAMSLVFCFVGSLSGMSVAYQSVKTSRLSTERLFVSFLSKYAQAAIQFGRNLWLVSLVFVECVCFKSNFHEEKVYNFYCKPEKFADCINDRFVYGEGSESVIL